MASVALASHVEYFGGSGYKRDHSRMTQVDAPSVRGGTALTVPTVTIDGSGAIPATSARPDQRVNARVPIARACGQPLVAGQVAFVSRGVGFKRASGGAEVAPAFAGTHALSMEHLNELLDDPIHHVTTFKPAGLLFFSKAKALLSADGKTQKRAFTFNANDFFKTRNQRHPLLQYALDGVVCTSSDDQGDEHGGPIGSSVGYCNVAVKGPAPMLAHRTLHDKMRAVVVAPYPQTSIVPNTFYLQPADIMAKVYVVLVAILVEKTAAPSRKYMWKFQYELVSSSNVNTLHGFKRFTDTIVEPTSIESLVPGPPDAGSTEALIDADNSKRMVLQVLQLGRVVDTKFGNPRSPSLVLSVNVKPYEATHRRLGGVKSSTLEPLSVLNSFVYRPIKGGKALTNSDKLARAAGVAAMITPTSKGLFKMAGGFKSLLTGAGVSKSEFDALKQAVADVQLTLGTLVAAVHSASDSDQDAIKTLDDHVAAMSTEHGVQFDTIKQKIVKLIEESTVKDAMLAIKTQLETEQPRIFEWAVAFADGQEDALTVLNPQDEIYKEFAKKIVEHFQENGMFSPYVPFPVPPGASSV